MISFKSFLVESRTGPLYHATEIGNLESILVTGLNGTTLQNQYKGKGSATRSWYGVSTARTTRASIEYYKKNIAANADYVVLELDHTAIRNKYKIFPVDYWATKSLINKTTGDRGKEEEEFIIIPLVNSKEGFLPSKYIKRILYVKQNSPLYNRLIDKIKNSKIGKKFEWREI